MVEIQVDMMLVDQDIVEESAEYILDYVEDVIDAGATLSEMLVALGVVIEALIGEDDGQVAH